MPVLGLIFLRHATTRFHLVGEEVKKTLPARGGVMRPLNSDDFKARAAIFLPAQARYDYLVTLPDSANIGEEINKAMGLIEDEVPMLRGALPKTYHRFDAALLARLLRIFNRDALRTATGDVFGRIYEYFLNKFAMTGAQEGGEFFTPPSLVRLIVNVIEPDHGNILDPACGSAGMAVQTGHFLEQRGTVPAHAITFYGQEKSETTVNLAKMNLAVHGLEGNVVIGNTYYEDIHGLVGQCDFVMANPPFNVDLIDPEKVKNDPRLFTSKKIPGISSKTKTVSNGNYLWMQYFYSYLNERGRAGFVMASSASDAGHGERQIRKEIIATGAVDVVIAIGTNFFYTRSLPCTLWFYDRGKPAERRDKTLMIDARSIYRVVTRKINDFSDEQLANITAIVWLYRGENDRYLRLVGDYLRQVDEQGAALPALFTPLDAPMTALLETLAQAAEAMGQDPDRDQEAVQELTAGVEVWREKRTEWAQAQAALWADLQKLRRDFAANAPTTNDAQQRSHAAWDTVVPRLKELQRETIHLVREMEALVEQAAKDLGAGKLTAWNNRDMREQQKTLAEARDAAVAGVKRLVYFLNQAGWLQSRFPDGVYADVLGLCKVVDSKTIPANDDSLTPGRYVGVAPIDFEDDDVFEEQIVLIHSELQKLNEEASSLASLIQSNIAELI